MRRPEAPGAQERRTAGRSGRAGRVQAILAGLADGSSRRGVIQPRDHPLYWRAFALAARVRGPGGG